jgi:predicted O-linked N-acetylglucosamine transferase (SPINDLY family)
MVPEGVRFQCSHKPAAVINACGGRLGQADAQWRKGVRGSDKGRWAHACPLFGQAARLAPNDAVCWLNLAQANRKVGELPGAETGARRALALNPADLLACKLSGTTLAEKRCHAEAAAVFAQLFASVTRDHDFHCVLGEALYWDGRYTAATERFLFSFTRKPDHGFAHGRLFNVFSRLGMHEESAERQRTIELLQLWDAQALGNLIHRNQQACRWDTLVQDTADLARVIAERDPPQTTPFAFMMVDSSEEQQRRVAKISVNYELCTIAPLLADPQLPRPVGERLCIGYVSSDFQHHVTSMLITEVLESHDRCRSEAFLDSCAPDDRSAWRRQVHASFEYRIDASQISDHDPARRSRADGIDIAIDLKGFTRDTRLRKFARLQAPIQVSWLGYPANRGTPFITYLIGNPVVTPPASQRHFSERIVQMPRCHPPNYRQRPLGEPPSREALGLPQDAFMFCCFNIKYKITPRVFDIWCRPLRAVPGSMLWPYEANTQAMRNLLREARARGVYSARCACAPSVAQAQKIARPPSADLFFYTLPCNVLTTASDALWASLPVITCEGESFVGRVVASLFYARSAPRSSSPDRSMTTRRWRTIRSPGRDSRPLGGGASERAALRQQALRAGSRGPLRADGAASARGGGSSRPRYWQISESVNHRRMNTDSVAPPGSINQVITI